MANTFRDTGGTPDADEEDRRREDRRDRGSDPPSSSPSEGGRRAVERDQQRDTGSRDTGANAGRMVDDTDDVTSGYEDAVQRDQQRDTGTPDRGGVSDGQQQNIDAAFQRQIEGFGQGEETRSRRAREFEQSVLDDNQGLQPEDVRIEREGTQLVARYTDSGRERLGVNPTDAEIREQVAAGSQFDADELQVTRTAGGAQVSLTAGARRQRERSYENYLRGIQDLVSNDPGRAQGFINQAPAGARRAVANTPEAGPITLRDLSPQQQRDVNEDLIGQFSTQIGARERRRSIANTEFRNDDVTLFRIEGTSPEEFTRGVADSIRGGARDVSDSLVPADRSLVVPTSSGVFVFEGDSGIADASRGAVRSLGDFGAAPFDAALAVKEGGEFTAEGVRSFRAGEGGEFVEDTQRAGTELVGNVRDQFDANPAGFTTRLVGTAALTGGAIRGAQLAGGTRAARATSFAIQPGEDIVRAAARRGRISARTAGVVPGVSRSRLQTEIEQFRGADRGQLDLTGSGDRDVVTAEDLDVPTRSPDPPVRALEFDDDLGDLSTLEIRRQRASRRGTEREFDEEGVVTSDNPMFDDPRPARGSQNPLDDVRRKRQRREGMLEESQRAQVTEPEANLPRSASVADSLLRTEASSLQQLAQQQEVAAGRTELQRQSLRLGQRDLLDSRERAALGEELRFDQLGDVRTETAVDTLARLDTEQRLQTNRRLETELRTELGVESRREFGTEFNPEFNPEGRLERFAPDDRNGSGDVPQLGFGGRGGTRGPAGEDLLAPGYFAETAQGFVAGAFTEVTSPSQSTLREIAGDGGVAAELPTQEIVSGEVDIEPVYDLFSA